MRTLTLLISFLFLLSLSLKAQEANRVSAEVNTTAIITQSIQLITVNSMSFGNIQPGQLEVYINPINDANGGFMIAVGTPEAEFRLDYLQERILTRVEGGGDLTFSYEISGSDIEDQSSSELFDFDNRTLRFNTEGRFYLWVGGRLNLENARPGNYEGDFTIEIDYI